MNGNRKFWQAQVLASVLCALIGPGHAQAPDAKAGPAPASTDNVPAARAGARTLATHEIRAAVRLISQAALQRDFASNARIHNLLQTAQDILASADTTACCDSRSRLIDLKRDLDHAVNRGDCLLYTSPSPRDGLLSRMPSSA